MKTKEVRLGWIQNIPVDWDVKKIKYLVNRLNEEPCKDDEVITAFRDGQVTLRKNRREDGFTFSLKEIGYQHINKGNLVVHQMDAFAGAIGISDSDGKGSPVYTVCEERNPQEIYLLYLSYQLKVMSQVGYIQSLAKGIRERSTDFRWNDMGNLYVALPSFELQKKIVNYLEQKITDINKLILYLEKCIELLFKQRQSIITETVTKGLNPNVKMKDSGVKWIGEIPEHWEVKKLKNLGKFVGGYAFPSNSFVNNGIKVIKINNIQTMYLDWSDISYVTDDWLVKLNQYQVKKGDLVIALTRPIISTGIKAAIVDTDELLLLNQRNAYFRSNERIPSNWLYYLVLNQYFIEEFESLIDRTGQQPNISANAIENIKIPLPNSEEIQQITKYLDKKTIEIEELKVTILTQVSKLKEYRQSLIYEAVTGKIDVRDMELD
ncbi:restriction endonuclease subunit S, partial [Bacillus sp. SXabc123]|nr:restriction endonuclease subunit S [Bacillus sp. SXabc123]